MHNRALGILATTLRTVGAAAELQTDTGFAVVGNERIYYESTGSGDAVVLSHGAGGSHAIWMHQVPVLAEHCRVITWDQRGWGKSTNAAELAGDPNTAVEDLRYLLDHLGVAKAHVIGQSMGGWAVAGFTLRYPERTRSLTLANTYGGLATEAMREFMTPERILERQAGGRPTHIADPVRAFQYAQLNRLAPPRPPIDLDAKLRPDLEAARKTTVPMLIVTGTHDWIFPPEMMRMLDAELPTSRLVEIPDAGHSPYFEFSEAWNRVVLEHLGG